MLFYGDGLTYYAALVQHDAYRRVVVTSDAKSTETVYAYFGQRRLRLSEASRQRPGLDAHTAKVKRMIADAQACQAQAQADFDHAQEQSEKSTALQTQAAQELTVLRQEQLSEQSSSLRHVGNCRLCRW
uniref:DUF2968 domain-containing protein n=1 Tax=Caballeronia sp. LjRoot34 TaxID=3342325 RepID=UPI003F502235